MPRDEYESVAVETTLSASRNNTGIVLVYLGVDDQHSEVSLTPTARSQGLMHRESTGSVVCIVCARCVSGQVTRRNVIVGQLLPGLPSLCNSYPLWPTGDPRHLSAHILGRSRRRGPYGGEDRLL